MTGPQRSHYSYTVYRDPQTARTFDDRRFGGPIGELVAEAQAEALLRFSGTLIGTRVLDVATGTGRAALLLASKGAHVVGVDQSEEMLGVARARADAEGLPLQFATGDAHALEFRDRSFDIVVSLRLLMHAPDWRRCVAELCRVADRLVIVDYPSAASAAAVQAIGRRFLHAIGVSTEPYRVMTEGQIDQAFEAAGFRVRSVHRQFALPIAFHKAIGSRRFTVFIEEWLDRAGLLRICGSPVTLVAERCASS